MSTAEAPPSPTNPSVPSFIPLEANPDLLTSLLHNLGLSSALAIHDVYSLTDPSLLAFIPRPAYALLLVFPLTKAYEEHRVKEDAERPDYEGKGEGEPVVWFPQTIRNACGLIGLLHAASNGAVRDFVVPGSDLERIIKSAEPLGPRERAKLLETDETLAKAHRDVAVQGDTAAPRAEEDVDLHFVCFVKGKDGGLWEMDGRRKGPIRRGDLEEGEDVLSERALELGPRKFLEREGEDLRFSCVALAGSFE
ncbi:ubiquitin carboxyl-terminal hydrolase-like protein [Thermochaetoides thermophila DSM 1495]|uniref:Ubiquitin carboxyl-terminal hydrolase n=1 Tax=Chaetomium thermophilum (strain DSM 1495 / CBS 144.50 / IMI 039719) TaxID=759272 RepID=G0S5G5_CHATD|nr:ubiquitin carboxyl-terminal hydrolase-like protein [Thermochaetoides thermophila DSM 1495]EGS21430.1 ubiquitin carboxyl-terminal hydrolase-like protein [Thermochaetoides thermophila DSM 1495]